MTLPFNPKPRIAALFCAYIIALSGAMSVSAESAWAQETPDEDDQIKQLSGDAYFDFAFRDQKNILQEGHLGDSREAVAQAETKNEDDAQNEESPGFGLNNEEVSERLEAIPDSKSYRIADLTLACDIDFCKNKDNVDALLRATGLELGHLTNARELALSIERLRKTGYFSNIFQTVKYQGERIEVHFKTTPHTIIRKIIIDEGGALYDSEIKKRMILRPGSPLYPRTALLRGMEIDEIPKEKLISMALEDQEKSLKRAYVKEGYFDAEVKITPEEITTNLVDLHINVENAESYVLGQIYVRGHSLKTYAEIESAFRSEFSIFESVSKDEIEDAVEAVLMSYRKAGYYQTKIDFVSRRVPEKKTVDVFLDIKEAAHWEVQFEGNSALSTKELMQALTFESAGYVDRAEVESSAAALEQTYISAGYYWANVYGEMLHGSNQSNVLVFKIDEGKRAEIGEIVFDGASVLSRDELLNTISSTEYSAFGSGAYPQRSMIADDAAKIVDIYRERGYLNADVTGWTLEPIETNGRLRLTFIIREGKRSYFATRQIRYTDRETYDAFDVKIDQPKDDVFSDNAFRTERAAITKQLRARGHATIADKVRCTSYTDTGNVSSEETCEIADFPAECMPDSPELLCTMTETPEGIRERCKRHYDTAFGVEGEAPCKLDNGITGTLVDVEYEITLGPKYAFGDVFVHGNNVTRDWVVHQDVNFKAGETFDYNKIIDARSLLRRRQIYRTASLNVIGVDDGLESTSAESDSTSATEYPVPLVVNLEEGDRRWIDFALGLSLNNKDWILTGEMEFVEANLLGTGWELRLLVMPEARFFSGSEFVFTQKFNQNFFTLLTVSIPVIPASGFNIVTQLFYDLRYIPDINKEEYGWLVELQWNINKQLFSALAFELESSKTSTFGITVDDDISNYHPCYPVTFFQTCPFTSNDDNATLTVSLTPRVAYDGRDNPLTPKSGIYAEGKLKLAYSEAAKFYVKPEVRASYIFTFLNYFTLAFNGRFGVSFLKQKSRLPLIDRYFLGGLNMRGYDNEALGPRLVNSTTPDVATNEAGGGEVLFNFTSELRFPIWNEMGLFGAVFLDMGALTQYQPTHYSAGEFARELFAKEMRYTAGIGLRWLISESIPPIVIDYGFILNRRRGDPIGGFNLNVGYTF